MQRKHTVRRARRRGAMLPLVAILLPVMLILASFIVNLSYMELTRTELRIASDSATRAAGFELSRTQDQTLARAAARDGANRNKVAGKATQLADSDIVFGVSRRASVAQRYKFTAGGTQVNAVTVNARRNAGSLSGTISLVMPTFGAVNKFGPSQQAISTQVECDIALVLDRSGSMAYGDLEDSEKMAAAGLPPAGAPTGWQFCDPAPPASRWRSLVDSAGVFVAALNKSPQREFVSMVTYSDAAKQDLPLSGNYGKMPAALDVYTQKYCSGFTNIHDGIVEGVNSLNSGSSRPWAVKVVIVLTDGRRTKGADPVLAAQSAFSQGVAVYTVTYSNEADIPAMKAVAAKGGGQHFHAANGADLKKVFSTIAGKLPILLTQ
jgi:Ca-activated chloride channel homolog